MKHLGVLSFILALLAIAVWPLVNTMLTPWLASAAVAVGVVALIRYRQKPILPIAGITSGSAVLLGWLVVMYLASSAATGRPL